MNANMLSARLFGDTEVATPLEIIASGALYEAGFSTPKQKTRNRSFSRPSGMRLRGWGRRLTKTEEQESIINRSARIHLSGREIRLKKRSHPSARLAVSVIPVLSLQFY